VAVNDEVFTPSAVALLWPGDLGKAPGLPLHRKNGYNSSLSQSCLA